MIYFTNKQKLILKIININEEKMISTKINKHQKMLYICK